MWGSGGLEGARELWEMNGIYENGVAVCLKYERSKYKLIMRNGYKDGNIKYKRLRRYLI